MHHVEAREEYAQALKKGKQEYKELVAAGKHPYPAVLDEILADMIADTTVEVGLVEAPLEQIVGVKSAGRITAFTAGFYPLLSDESEFAHKWIDLCVAHLGDEGIREPIICFEYLGNFYVQEGNKRVSVMKHFGASRIPAIVRRILPPHSEEPRIVAYYEFLDFFKNTGLYSVQFSTPGMYDKLCAALGKTPGESWEEKDRRTFAAYFQYFREAFYSLGGQRLDMRPEEALLVWLRVHPFSDIGKLSTAELKKAMTQLWEDVVSVSQPEPVNVRTEPSEAPKPGILSRILSPTPDHVNVAFVHQRDTDRSNWVRGHEEGRQLLEHALGDRVTVRSYFHADTAELAEQLLEQAVSEGAEVIFTTTPQLSRVTLKMAVKYPKVRFLNCSVNAPYSSIRSYYSRIYEAKFITGAIAGAMANYDHIGYVGDYPIFGVPACINAFALGAQLTNPRAKIQLRWTCLGGQPVEAFRQQGIRVISNRDIPTPDNMYLEFGSYGTYLLEDNDELIPLASPCWMWGTFYENVVRSILDGKWNDTKNDPRAVNYWWGFSSGVIDVRFSEKLPTGVRLLAEMLRDGLRNGTIDPFRRPLVAQDGTVISQGDRALTPDELLHMDWLVENVEGIIPEFEDILPFSQNMVRELGVHRDRIPAQKEVTV